MKSSYTIKNIEKKAWQINFEDGISDITIGLILVATSICQVFNEYRFGLYTILFIPPIFSILAKKFITTPRLGIVNFNKKRKQKRKILFFILTSSILILLFFTIKGLYKLNIQNTPVFIGIIILAICGSIAFTLNYTRMYIWGIFVTMAFTFSEITTHKTGNIANGAWYWLITGIIIIFSGSIYLTKFIRKYEEQK